MKSTSRRQSISSPGIQFLGFHNGRVMISGGHNAPRIAARATRWGSRAQTTRV